jgi:hypothetical protein
MVIFNERRKTMRTIPLALFGLIALGAVHARPAAADEALRLTLDVENDRPQLGEPVTVTVTLANDGAEPVEIMGRLEPEYGFVRFTITDPHGESARFAPWALKEHAAPETVLAPGDAVTVGAKLFYGADGWTFDGPGVYRIEASYLERITADPITITVQTPPTPRACEAAALLVQSEEAGRFLMLEGGDHLKDGLNRVERVATDLPETPQAALRELRARRESSRGLPEFSGEPAAAGRRRSRRGFARARERGAGRVPSHGSHASGA